MLSRSKMAVALLTVVLSCWLKRLGNMVFV